MTGSGRAGAVRPVEAAPRRGRPALRRRAGRAAGAGLPVWLGLLACLGLLAGLLPARAAADGDAGAAPLVLLLQSYHAGQTWSDGIQAGVEAALAGRDVELSIEYLDSKRRPLAEVAGPMAAYLRAKYAGRPPDVIVAADNNALAFLRRRADTLFPDVPVVFTGINGYRPAFVAGLEHRATGVLERTDPLGTARLALRLRPAAERVVVVTGASATAQAVRAETEAALAALPARVALDWWDGLEIDALLARLGTLGEADVVLLTLFNLDGAGRYYPYEESARLIAEASAAPVFGLWDFYIGTGVAGGRVADAVHQGEAAGRLAGRILDGEAPAAIPVVRRLLATDQADADALARFGIPLDRLPPDALVINHDPSWLHDNWRTIVFVLGLMAAEALALVALGWLLLRARRRAAQEARAAARRRAATLHSIGDAVISTDRDGRIVEMNPVAEALTGWSQAEACGRPLDAVFRILDGGSRRPQDTPVGRVLADGRVAGLANDTILVDRHGGERQIADSAAPIRDADGAIIGVVLVFRDVSAEYAARAEIRRLNERFDLAADSAGIGVWEFDPQDDVLVWDDRMFALYGTRRENFAGAYEAWAGGLHPEDSARAQEEVRRAVRDGVPFDTQFRVVHPSGTVRHLRAFAQVVADARTGAQRMIGVNYDVTERTELLERLTKISRSVPGVIYQFRLEPDGTARMPYASEGLADVFGVRPEAVREDAGPLFARLHPDDLAGLWDTIHASSAGLRVWNHEFRVRHPDKGEIWVAGRAMPDRQPDGSTLWHGFISDVTERRAAERTRDALAAVVENSDDIVVIKDLDLRVVATNQAFADASGRASTDELIGRTDAEIFGLPPEAEPVRTYMADERRAQALPRGEAVVREEPVVAPDGGVRYVLTRKYPIYDRRNVLIGTGNISADITARRRAEEALAASERRFRDIAQTMSDWIWEIDTDLRYTYVAGNVADVLGYRPDELLGRSCLDLIADPAPDGIAPRLHAVMAARAPIEGLENWNRAKDGRLVCLLTSGVPMVDADGILVGYRGMDQDITDRKRIEEQLKLRERALEAAANGVLITRADGDQPIVYCNPAFERMTGYAAGEVLGRNCRFLQGDDRDQPVLAELRAAMAEGRTFGGLLRNYRKDGTPFWNQCSIAPVMDAEGRVTHHVGIQQDVTDRQRQERELRAAWHAAEQASRAKSEFLATMSHELRTPLNAINGFSQMMEQHVFGPLGDAHYETYAHDIHASGEHLLALINDLLDMAKIEAGRMTLNEESLSLADIVQSVLVLVREKARDHGLELTAAVDPALPALWADARAVKQMLINLLSNALKFTPDRGRVTVAARAGADGGLVLSVADTGVGIAPEDREAVLEPFRQGRSAAAAAEGGTGLGLSLVKSLIELHGGAIVLDSRPGGGTVVSLHFPPERVIRLAAAG